MVVKNLKSNLSARSIDTQLELSAVPIRLAVKATQPVSLSSSPLSTDVATESTLAALNNKFNTTHFLTSILTQQALVKVGGRIKKELLLTKLVLFQICNNLRQHNSNRTIIGTIDPVHTQMVLSMTWHLVLV